MRKFLVLAILLIHAPAAPAQVLPDTVRGIPRFPFDYSGLALSGPPRTGIAFRDYSRRAAVIGDEFGNFDVVIDGDTVVRDLHFAFRLDDSDTIIERSRVAKWVTRRPEGLTIVYSHPAFTVREHIFIPLDEPGVIALLDVQTVRPLDVLVRTQDASNASVFVGAPSATHGPRSLRIDAAATRRDFMPVIIAGGVTPDSVADNYLRLFNNVERHWREKVAYFRGDRKDLLSADIPDARMEQAFEWAKIDLDQRAAKPAALSAMSFVGQFDLARAALLDFGSGPHASFEENARWILASFEYWNASRDNAFLRATWPAILEAFSRNATLEKPAARTGAIWAAALESVEHMARAMSDDKTAALAAQHAAAAHTTLENAWLAGPGAYAIAVNPPTAMALGMLDAERSDRMLRELGSSANTADWGARALSQHDSLYDPLHAERGAVTPTASGTLAMAHYRHHRAWSGFDLTRDIARMILDFERGRAPEALSGAYYRALNTNTSPGPTGSAMLVAAFVRGLAGWHADAPHRAAALEPHLPPAWPMFSLNGLRLGGDRIDATISRERGLYTIGLRRRMAGPPLSIRVAPALPLGARIERIVIDDADVEVQVEESAHDLHGVANVALSRDAQIEFHYAGGMEIVTPAERVDIGDASTDLRVIEFRREGRDYIAIVEGMAGTKYSLQLRSETSIRNAVGADSFEQDGESLVLRVTLPAGSGFTRRTVRMRP